MTDDLVKRLREVGGISDDGATRWYINPDGPEAADRIEKLEAALIAIKALHHEGGIDDLAERDDRTYFMVCEALEGKDD